MNPTTPLAPGARVLIRDEEWLVLSTDPCTLGGGYQINCVGVSETVRNRPAHFLTALDDIELIDPAKTELVQDTSPAYLASRLSIEARIRQSPPTTESLVQGHLAVMDTLPFQLVPAHRVVGQIRPRLLLADTVGLGKTLEAGILAAELARRGKARRILVVTTKSMMRQFQHEFWTRFSIALIRLDSAGIQRIRRDIPTYHNPFNHLDRTIISVDTLKRDGEYRHYLEQAWWDLIIIDEAHNVSYKGNRTQSNKLASLLAQRSDALILLTATPHNGKKESFASLMRMLDPTVLPENADYTRDDVAHLFIRRFKQNVREQMRQDFPERVVYKLPTEASPVEDQAFDHLAALQLAGDSTGQRDGAMLFRTTLEKALFSSPAACLQTLKERLRRLTARDAGHADIAPLQTLQNLVAAITPAHFSKFQHLISQLTHDPHWRWQGRDPADRLVLFTERIETLKFLHQHLPPALELTDNAVAVLHGQLSDTDIQKVVEDFGKSNSPLRLLIASDVASEGLNLHYQAHRLLHFDIPWSLMVFQQRNGRVDRYGQTQAPQIGYLLTTPANSRLRGDLRILEILITKDEQAAKNIGDPSAFMGLYDEELEAALVAKAMESNTTAAAFDAQLAGGDKDPFEVIWAETNAPDVQNTTAGSPPPEPITAPTESLPSIFASEYRYVRDAFRWLHAQALPQAPRAVTFDDSAQALSFQPDSELNLLLSRELHGEMWPRDNQFTLSADKQVVAKAIRQARNSNDWPQVHYLWPLHPVAQWLDFKLLTLFGRQRAPVLRVSQGIPADEAIVLVLAQVPNRRGQTMLTEWLCVPLLSNGQPGSVLPLDTVLQRTRLADAALINDGQSIPCTHLQKALPAVLHEAERHLHPIKKNFDTRCHARLQAELDKLSHRREHHFEQLTFDFARGLEQVQKSRRQRKEEETERLFADYQAWARQTLELDDRAQFTVVAVLTAPEDLP